MDVHCQSCREPWDTYHLRHDAIHETDLTDVEKAEWNGKLTPHIRAAFKSVGYEFGASVVSVRRCPGCGPEDTLDKEHATKVAILHDLLGDDTDGIEAMMEDFDL